MKKRIAFVTNVDWFFISHRLPLAIEALKRGYDVYLLTLDTGRRKEIEALGINFINIPFKRSGSNPFHELYCIYVLCKNYRQIEPTVIHHITLKAALLGSLAAKLVRNGNVVNAISGLGYNFTDNRNGILQKVIKLMINKSFKHTGFCFILQNPDDVEMISKMNLVPVGNIFLIKGSGVDLNVFKEVPLSNKAIITFLFPARILLDKGVMEFIKAAKSIREVAKGRAKFVLCGDCDEGNLAVLRQSELESLLEDGYIEWRGFQKGMYPIYSDSDVVVLPSYREGLPKSLIEACAVGRPIITTDVPGCRECVIEGYNGFIVPAKDIKLLAQAMCRLLGDMKQLNFLGQNSRKLAEQEFSIESVIDKTFGIYNAIHSRQVL